MKLLKIVLPVCCVLAVAMALSACREEPPVPGPPDPAAEEYSVANKIASDFSTAISEMKTLSEESGITVPRRVTNQNGMQVALADANNRLIRLEDKEETGTVTVPEGDYSNRDFIFDAPNADITVNASVGKVTVKQANENGCTVNGHAETVFVCGGDLNVTLSGGADKLYVSGKNANVVLEDGDYPVIYCDNITDVISNKTKNDLLLILPNGVATEIPAGKMYVMENGKLKSAR